MLAIGVGLLALGSASADLTWQQQAALVVGLVAISGASGALFRHLLWRDARRLAEAMLEALPNPVYLKSMDGRYSAVNSAWEAFLGISRETVIGRTAQELEGPSRAVIEKLDASDDTVRERSGFHVYMDVIARPDGARHDAIVCKASCKQTETPLVSIVGSIIDMTDRKRAERRMVMEHAVTRVLAEAESLDKVVPTIIETICKTMGWDYGALYKYHPTEKVLRCEEMWGIATDPIREFMANVSRRVVKVSDPSQGLVRRTFALGKPVWIANIATDDTLQRKALVIKAGLHGAFAFPLRAGSEVLGILEFFHAEVMQPDAMLLEIAESIGTQIGQYIVRRKAEAEKYLAMHDAVTGLPNRLLFMERFEHALVQAKRHARLLAVMFIDLDRFKQVNDTFGHEAGDMLLQEIAHRLKSHLREGDTVARLGGDEFVMLLEEITCVRDMLPLGEKLIGELRRPCSIAGNQVTVTASIGVSAFPSDGLDSAKLLRHADAAMYRAKARGRNLCELYSVGDDSIDDGSG
jgi:diguanylate cyclase (GGDEF)-like protein/PAS domain S-box-containing protein